MAKRGTATLAICSTAFVSLGRAQAGALGYPGLTIGAVPHPFGLHSRDEIHGLARKSVDDIVRMVDKATVAGTAPSPLARTNAARIELVDEVAAINRFYREHGWTDGLPIMPPTVERVESMMRYAARAPDDIVACIAPGFGAATVERIAVNAVMAGCEPSHQTAAVGRVEDAGFPLDRNRYGTHAVGTTRGTGYRVTRYDDTDLPDSGASRNYRGRRAGHALRLCPELRHYPVCDARSEVVRMINYLT